MCGIFGYIGNKEASPILVKGLSRLEYRGYDSAGIAVLNGSNSISLKKKKGKVGELNNLVQTEPCKGTLGIGHTRWATHGAPSDANAHPHLDASGKLAVVHNGIIENYAEIKQSLIDKGYTFNSDTDTEVLTQLISYYFDQEKDLLKSLKSASSDVKGSYALGLIHSDFPDQIIATRIDSPLVIGKSENENFIASDVSALLDHTRSTISIENGDVVLMNRGQIKIWDKNLKEVQRDVQEIEWTLEDAEKQGHPHFMIKEILEQPDIVQALIQKHVHGHTIELEQIGLNHDQIKSINKIVIVGCGSSYHAGLVGRYSIESLTPFSVWVDNSSEFRYRDPKVDDKTLVIVISQSGETADTLAALREARKKNAMILGICNALGSSIERESDGVINSLAGPEIAVASTKAYTAQIAVLQILAFYLDQIMNGSNKTQHIDLLESFKTVPGKMQQFLDEYHQDKDRWNKDADDYNKRYHKSLEAYFNTQDQDKKRAPNAFFLFLGRNMNYPNAMEGALKLKEIAYISAEGYAAGEMKHGPIALIDENPWVICIATQSKTYDKMVANIEEIKARGGLVTAIITKGDKTIKNLNLYLYIEVPEVEEMFSPLVVALPMQLIAYTVADFYKEEIDQPRNLAKSVTVE